MFSALVRSSNARKSSKPGIDSNASTLLITIDGTGMGRPNFLDSSEYRIEPSSFFV